MPHLKGTTMSTLTTMTIKDLIALHNEHVDDEGKIKSFKGRKDDLIKVVAGLIRKSRGTTIREVAERLLMEVAETVDGQKIGHPYEYVLEQVQAEFPEGNTSVKSLRWYNTKLNGNPNIKMPIRPRKKVVKPAVTTSDEQSETPILDAIVEEFETADPIA